MIKLVIGALLIVVFSTNTFVFAKSENSNSNSGNGNKDNSGNSSHGKVAEDNNSNSNKQNQGSSSLKTKDSTPSATCDPNANWKNHGEYVSCVAKLKVGGGAVSEAARSDVGKKNKNSTPSASFSPSPIASGSATPSATPIASESAHPVGLISPEIINKAKNVIIEFLQQLQALFSL